MAAAPAACASLTGPGQIPSPTIITFDDLPAGTSIGEFYRRTHGVSFEEGRTRRVLAYDHPLARSAPMTALSDTGEDPAVVPLRFTFDAPQASVGLFAGNGGGVTTARLEGFDAGGNLVCSAVVSNVPDGHTAFIGFRDDTVSIASVALSYVASAQAESMDDLHFSAGVPATATPTATRTATPTPTRTPPAPLPAALFISPAQVAPGGQPRVGGYGFPALAELRLVLACPGQGEVDLAAVQADAAGRLQAAVEAPAYPPNPCLLSARQGRTTLAETALTILPALELAFAPPAGPPGTTVNFTVRNLAAGDLRLDYAGRAVVGPLRVAAGSYTGSFVVPGDRPLPLGSTADLRATNLLLGRVTGAATGSFGSQAGPIPPAYRVMDLRLPPASLPSGSASTITGRISPAPQGPLAGFQVVPVWQKADGRRFPIGRAAVQLAADGSFSAPVRVPSLLAGDPTWPEAGDLAGVMLFTSGDPPQPFLQAIVGLPIYPTFKVKVVDAATGQLIPSAKVSFEVWQGYQADANSLPLGQVAGDAATGVSNQIGQVLGTTELTDDEKAQIALTKYLCIPQAIPIGQTEWEVTSPTLDQALSEPAVQGLVLANSVLGEAAAAAGGPPPGSPAPNAQPASAPAAGEVIPYLLTVDAMDAGYGLKDADGLKNLSLRVNFHLADLTYRDLAGQVLSNPYIVKLGQFSPGDQSALGPIGVFVAGIGTPVLPDALALPRFDHYYSTTKVPAGVKVTKLSDGSLTVGLSLDQYHNKLGPGGMKLYLDGAWIADIPLKFNPGLVCSKFKGTQQTSLAFYVGKAIIPNAHLLAAGLHRLRIEAQLAGGSWTSYSYDLKVDPVSPAWFAVPAAGTRHLDWQPAGVTLFTPWLTTAQNTILLTSGAETDETGPLDNRTRAQVDLRHQAKANGYPGVETSGFVSGQAINKDAAGCSIHTCKPAAGAPNAAQVGAPAANPVSGYTYGPRTDEVVPKVEYDIPLFSAGIPFVAQIVVGGRWSYSASITYSGQITVFDDASVDAKIRIVPVADIGGGMWIHDYLLGGVLQTGKIELDADIRLGMPVTYNSKSGADLGEICFTYTSTLTEYTGELCDPTGLLGGGCVFNDDNTDTLFNDEEPDGCKLPGPAAAANTAAQQPPPTLGLHLASNGFGQVMALYQTGHSTLASSLWNGATWSAPATLATGLGNLGPRVVYLTPATAIAAWSETGLTGEQLPGLGIEDVIKARRIAFATWDGTSWSAAQPFSAPALGDAGVTLAACPEWQPGCPAGGEAIAVWERNLSTDLEARNIRLYYARYQNGAWGAAQPVDNAGAFTDILPQVVYANGRPLAAWVRDSDADLTDGSSRRIALRFLDSGPTFTPAELPAGIAEVALAMDGSGAPFLAFTRFEEPGVVLGNQRPLWIAGVTCTGPTTCTWQPHPVTDPYGRTLYTERPLLAVGADGRPRIIFRGMGFGGQAPGQVGDPPGMRSGSGELAQAVIDFTTGQVAPAYLTQDGAVNWLPAAAYDPLLDAIVATAIQGPAPAGIAGAGVTAAASTFSPAPDLPIAAAAVAALPDFALADASVAGGPATGAPLRLTARIANTGTSWPGSAEQPLEIVATWAGPPGAGAPAGLIGLTNLDAAPFVTVTLDLAPPPAGLDALHELHVVVNPGLPIAEANAANNGQVLAVGGVAAPVGLWSQVQPGSPLVFLGWDAVADRRVAGYRVYRSEAGGAWTPVGGSFAPGYVDLAARAATAYRYAVAAYTAEGRESPLSSPLNVGARPLRAYLPLVARQ